MSKNGRYWRIFISEKMKSTYLNPILDTIAAVIKSMVHQDVVRGEVLTKNNNLAFGEISSVATLTGEGGTGSIAVSFPLEVIMKVAEKMLPRNAAKNGQSIEDLSSEIGLLFAGLVQSDLKKFGINLNASKPVVYAGQPHYLQHATKKAVTFVPFSSDIGTIFVELCFGSLKTSKSKS